MIRVDFHLHVGRVWGGRGKDISAPAEEAAKVLQRDGITHACVCYSDKQSMDTLQDLCPNVKFFRLQWITNFSQKIDEDAHGIKLHSHRGHSTGFSFGEQKGEYGLDYSSRELSGFLKDLPRDFIIQYHTQGSPSLVNISRPLTIAKLAVENPHLKHIVIHAGSFGLRSYYPTSGDAAKIFTSLSQEVAVREAVLAANRLTNIYLDTSAILNMMHYKSEYLFYNFEKAGLGSDWPFSEKVPYGSLPKLEKLLIKFFGQSVVENIHKRALHFLETPLSELYKEKGGLVCEFIGRSPEYLENVLGSRLSRLKLSRLKRLSRLQQKPCEKNSSLNSQKE